MRNGRPAAGAAWAELEELRFGDKQGLARQHPGEYEAHEDECHVRADEETTRDVGHHALPQGRDRRGVSHWPAPASTRSQARPATMLNASNR